MSIFNLFQRKKSSNVQSDNIEEMKKDNQYEMKPEFIIVMGGVCTGKTTYRNKNYSMGYSSIDAGVIFIELSQGKYYDFPSHLESKMNEIGLNRIREALKNKENIVFEIIGADNKTVEELLELSKKIGYESKVDYLECEMEEAWQRNVNRVADNISAHYCEPYHITWFKQAAIEYLNPSFAKKAETFYDYDDNIYDEDMEDYAFGRGNLSKKKIELIEKTLGKKKTDDNSEK